MFSGPRKRKFLFFVGGQTLVRKVENFDHTLMFVVHPKKNDRCSVVLVERKFLFFVGGQTLIRKVENFNHTLMFDVHPPKK
jgi:hypothetical protein